MQDEAARAEAVQVEAAQDEATWDKAAQDAAALYPAVWDQAMQDEAVQDEAAWDQAAWDEAVWAKAVQDKAAQEGTKTARRYQNSSRSSPPPTLRQGHAFSGLPPRLPLLLRLPRVCGLPPRSWRRGCRGVRFHGVKPWWVLALK